MNASIASSPVRAHIAGLDGLRAAAATMVFAFHAWVRSGSPQIAFGFWGDRVDVDRILNFGASGVTLFFVLSGFLLGQPFWSSVLGVARPVDIRHYLERRFFRIYPAYFVAVVIFALAYDVAHPLASRAIMFVSHLLLIHNMTEVTVFSLSAPLWSVATESQLYLVLPLLFAGVAFLRNRRFGLGIISTLTLAVTALLALAFARMMVAFLNAVSISPRLLAVDGRVLGAMPLTHVGNFAIGVVCGLLYIRFRKIPFGRSWMRLAGWELAILAIGIAIVLEALGRLHVPTLPPASWPLLAGLYGLLVLSVSLSRSKFGFARLLESWPVRSLGLISYSFYLYHDFVLHLTWRYVQLPLANPDVLNLGRALIAYPLTVGVAWLSYRLIERRFISASLPFSWAPKRSGAAHAAGILLPNGLNVASQIRLPVESDATEDRA